MICAAVNPLVPDWHCGLPPEHAEHHRDVVSGVAWAPSCKHPGCPSAVVGSSTTGKGHVCRAHNEIEWAAALERTHPVLAASMREDSRLSSALARADQVLADVRALEQRWASYTRRWTLMHVVESGPRDPRRALQPQLSLEVAA